MDVVCLGELLIDFVALEPGRLIHQGPKFQPAAGGAPANVAVGAAKLGLSSGFIGKVGKDSFGVFLKDTLCLNGVDTQYLIEDPRTRTTLAFVAIGDHGERDFVFYRDPGADTQLLAEELDAGYFQQARVFHFGSISLSQEPVRQATLQALNMAKHAGALISYDPNYRDSLWPDEGTAVEQMRFGMTAADLVKVSEEELCLIANCSSWPLAAEALLQDFGSISCLLVSRGAQGCTAFTRVGRIDAPGFDVKAVDTTGAGDAFMAAVLASLLKNEIPLSSATAPAELADSLRFANAAAAMSTLSSGAIPSLKTFTEVEQWLQQHSTAS